MTMSVPPPQAPRDLGDPAELAPEASLFARIEDLIDEEHALLLIPATERGRRDHERLHEIEDQRRHEPFGAVVVTARRPRLPALSQT